MTQTSTGEADLERQVSVVLSEFASEIMRYSICDMMQLMRRFDLSLPRVVTLMHLSQLGAASISQIGDYLNLSLGATSHLVDQLVEAGQVSRTEDPHDRRHKQVVLTEAGRALVAEIRQVRVLEMARRMAELPAPELEAALLAMTTLVAQLRDAPAGTGCGEPPAIGARGQRLVARP